MTFEQFCKDNLWKVHRDIDSLERLKYSDILPKEEVPKMMGTLRSDALDRVRGVLTEFEVTEETYFEKLTVLSDVSTMTPADQSYIFGRVSRGAWVVVDDDNIYIVGRGKHSVEAVQSTANNMKRVFREMKLNYSWWPCYAM